MAWYDRVIIWDGQVGRWLQQVFFLVSAPVAREASEQNTVVGRARMGGLVSEFETISWRTGCTEMDDETEWIVTLNMRD